MACWPRAGDLPVDVRSKSDYFDSLYHASVAVGLNTSAMIEAAILGHPVSHHPAARVSGQPGRHGSLPLPAARLRRAAALRAIVRGSCARPCGDARRPQSRSRAQRAVRSRVRASPRPRDSRDDGLRRGTGGAGGASNAARLSRCRSGPTPFGSILQPFADAAARAHPAHGRGVTPTIPGAPRGAPPAQVAAAHGVPPEEGRRGPAAERGTGWSGEQSRGRSVKVLFLVHNLGKTRHFERRHRRADRARAFGGHHGGAQAKQAAEARAPSATTRASMSSRTPFDESTNGNRSSGRCDRRATTCGSSTRATRTSRSLPIAPEATRRPVGPTRIGRALRPRRRAGQAALELAERWFRASATTSSSSARTPRTSS